MSDSGSSNGTSDEAGLKAVITCSVLAVAFILSIIIARLVDICYDRRTLADDASDISESTRQIIRARLSVIQFRKKEIKAANSTSAIDLIRKWVSVIQNKNESRQDVLDLNRPTGQSQKSNDAKLNIIENGILNEHDRPKTARNPFFSGAKISSVSPRIITRESRPMSSKVKTVSASLQPAQKGQPVSSLQQNLPNILLINANVPIKKPPPFVFKTVHFKDGGMSKTELPKSKDGKETEEDDDSS